MKPTILLAATLLTTPLLTQCIVVDENGNVPAPNVSGSAEESQDVYQIGVNRGRNDGRSGLSRNPSRHAGTYPASESDAFSMGYEKGYNQGMR